MDFGDKVVHDKWTRIYFFLFFKKKKNWIFMVYSVLHIVPAAYSLTQLRLFSQVFLKETDVEGTPSIFG